KNLLQLNIGKASADLSRKESIQLVSDWITGAECAQVGNRLVHLTISVFKQLVQLADQFFAQKRRLRLGVNERTHLLQALASLVVALQNLRHNADPVPLILQTGLIGQPEPILEKSENGHVGCCGGPGVEIKVQEN